MLTDILQPSHLVILLVIALVVLGPKRLPEAGRALGHGLREFKHSISTDHGHDPQVTPGRAVPPDECPPGQ